MSGEGETESDESDEESSEGSEGDEEEEIIAVRPSPLRNFVKEKKPDTRAGGDAVELLRDVLDDLAEKIWIEAARHADLDGRETVKERDIRYAQKIVFEPHDMVMQATADLIEMQSRFEKIASESPLHTQESDREEE